MMSALLLLGVQVVARANKRADVTPADPAIPFHTFCFVWGHVVSLPFLVSAFGCTMTDRLGIGLSERNEVTDLSAGQPAAVDGRLQVRAALSCRCL